MGVGPVGRNDGILGEGISSLQADTKMVREEFEVYKVYGVYNIDIQSRGY